LCASLLSGTQGCRWRSNLGLELANAFGVFFKLIRPAVNCSKRSPQLCWCGATMTKQIEAIYEQGIIRPLQPLELPEGTRLNLIVITHEQLETNGKAAKILPEIAALPLEGSSETLAGREHDSILYPKK
jgi:predicted DNA-binding antitoxin AbrB/MazE fold protein